MAKSLQEQLLAAGAVDKQRAQKIKKQKHKQSKQVNRGAGGEDEIKREAERAKQEKLARDRALAQKQQAALEAKAIAAQVRQLIERNRIDRDEADIAYKFADGATVKQIMVTAEQQGQLANGNLAVARIDSQYELIATPVAQKIIERDPRAIAALNDRDENEADDDYAEYEIPDDLMW